MVVNGSVVTGNQGDVASKSDTASKGLRCEFCSGRLHVVDGAVGPVGPTVECEDCGRDGVWDNYEKRVIPSHLQRPEPATP